MEAAEKTKGGPSRKWRRKLAATKDAGWRGNWRTSPRRSRPARSKWARSRRNARKLPGGLEEDLRDSYERLFKTKNGEAVVALEHEVCNGLPHESHADDDRKNAGQARKWLHCEQVRPHPFTGGD